MSSRYRRLAGLDANARITVEGEEACAGCGYMLTGLRRGGRCPECSTPIPFRDGPGTRPDPLLAFDEPARRRLSTALLLIGIGFLIVAFEPFVWIVFAVISAALDVPMTSTASTVARLARVVGAVLWCAAGFAALRAAFFRLPEAPGDRWRIPVLAGLVILVAAQGLAVVAPPDGSMNGLVTAGRVVGMGAGALALYILARAAEEADLDRAGDRVKTAAVGLPIIAVLMWLVPNGSMPWFGLVPYVLLIVLPWVAIGVRAALGLHEMRRHLVWGVRIGRQAAGREERVAERRAELDAEWQRTVRPLPGRGKPT